MDNLVLFNFYLEADCSQDDGEVSVSWKPVNFMIYSKLFIDMIYEAADEFLSDVTLRPEEPLEVLMRHVVDRDGAGAVLDEYFEPVKI
jgi:hypothetical protein